jgi:alpha-glucosidase
VARKKSFLKGLLVIFCQLCLLITVELIFVYSTKILAQNGDQECMLNSPNGEIAVTVSQATLGHPYPSEERLYYQVERKGQLVLNNSPLGLIQTNPDGSFINNLSFVSRQDQVINETYQVKSGKRSTMVNHAHQMKLKFTNQAGREIELFFRAYDDGVAFRYQIPGTGGYQVSEELSGFRLSNGTRGWAQEWRKNYEKKYYQRSLGNLEQGEWGHPILLETAENNWFLLAEAAVFGHYAVLHFQGEGNRLLRLEFPNDQTSPISGQLPLTTPWRVLIVGSDLGDLVESDLINNLNLPSEISDTFWIKPGRVAWSWWADNDSPGSLSRQKDYVDFAQEMGWEYVLVDKGWQASWIPEIILWSRASDFNENVAQQWANWGIKGAKIDFIESDSQEALQDIYDPFYGITAQQQLNLNFHGCTKPAGEERRWPHQLTREAVRGAEGNIFGDILTNRDNISLVFTRNVLGPMDYTPVHFSFLPTTAAHQLALSVLFESGLQHFPDTPESYRASPGKDFLKTVPVAWDETRFIDGYPDSHVILARRKGEDWYLGASVTEGGARQIPLTFLDEGVLYEATIYKDGSTDSEIRVETQEVSKNDVLGLSCREDGGGAIHFDYLGGATPTTASSSTPTPSYSAGDVNRDEVVDQDDAGLVFDNWSDPNSTWPDNFFEPDGNEKINGLDFGYVARDWGQ